MSILEKQFIIENRVRYYALKGAALSLAEVVEWADNYILSGGEPDPDLKIYDLSMAETVGTANAILYILGKRSSDPEVFQLTFKYFYEALMAGSANLCRLCETLKEMANGLDSECLNKAGLNREEMISFDERLYCTNLGLEFVVTEKIPIEGGYFGQRHSGKFWTEEEIKAELLAFLKKHKG